MPKFVTFLVVLSLSLGALAEGTKELNQCAVDLCGPASKKLTLRAGGVFQDVVPVNVKTFLKSELMPALVESFESFQKIQMKGVQAGKKILNHPSDFKLNKEQRSFLTIASVMSLIMKDAEQVLQTSDGSTYTVNREALFRLHPNMERTRVDLMAQVFDEFFESVDSKYANFAAGSDYDYFFRVYLGIQGELDLDRVQRIMPYFSIKFAEVIGHIGSFAFSDLDTSLLFRDLLKDPLSEVEKKEVMDIISRIFGYQGVFQEKIVELSSRIHISVEESLGYLNFKDKIRSREKAAFDPEFQEARRQEFFSQCSRSAIRFFAAAPSPLRLKANENLLGQVRAASLKTASRYFSGSSFLAAEKAILSLKTKKPFTSFEVERRLKGMIQVQKNRERNSESVLNHMLEQPEMGSDVLLYFVRDFMSPETSTGLDENLSRICQRLSPADFEDKAYGRDGLIQIGWQSSQFPEIGAGVMAHEIGHIISNKVQSESEGNGDYQRVRQCSMKRHELLSGQPMGQYAEEDWADHFAADVLRELSFMGIHGDNFGCALLGLEEEKAEYRTPRLFDPRGADTHSEGLLRALVIEKRTKGRIPLSCQRAIGENAKMLEEGFCGK